MSELKRREREAAQDAAALARLGLAMGRDADGCARIVKAATFHSSAFDVPIGGRPAAPQRAALARQELAELLGRRAA